MQLILITGYSGAGKSVTLKAFEDLGFACMDNIPMLVISSVIEAVKSRVKRLAICSDIRSPDFSSELFLEQLALLKERYQCRLWFLTCDIDKLISRFNSTKHRHPLHEENSVIDSLRKEKELLEPLRIAANEVIDSSDLTPHSLQHYLSHISHADSETISVQLVSFSYQKGLPQNADMVFDVRFLKNPYYDLSLRSQTGRDIQVANFIKRDPELEVFSQHLQDMLLFLLPLYKIEGKSYLTLAFGCTGGRHRSVYICEMVKHMLKKIPALTVAIQHRELDKIDSKN